MAKKIAIAEQSTKATEELRKRRMATSNDASAGSRLLAIRRPDIAEQWHPTKNGELKPDQVTVASHHRIWWICEKGHEWNTSVKHRTSGGGCPYHSGRKVLAGYNDLATLRPDIAEQWHPTKNGELKPDQVTISSNRKVWWQCENRHEWIAAVYGRTSGRDCHYCSGQKALAGYNDLASLRPDVAKQWHPTKNGELKPDMVTVSSRRKVWWLCGGGHRWEARISSRTRLRGNGCSVCSGHKILHGHNDLASLRPDVAKQWHPTKNGELKPSQVTVGSSREVWWICEKGHEWCTTIRHRTNGSGCPYCSGRMAITGHNDLSTLRPDIASQWHPTRNGELTPDMVTVRSGQKVWWICEKGHEWPNTVNHRTTRGDGCPHSTRKHSMMEIRIATELRSLVDILDTKDGEDRVTNEIGNNRCKPDIVLSKYRIAIDIDGRFWHKNSQDRDKAKLELMGSHGWKLIRVRERPLKKIGSHDIDCTSLEDIKDVVDKILLKLKALGVNMPDAQAYLAKHGPQNQKAADAEIASRGCGVDTGVTLATLRPDIAKQWHPTLNGELTADMVAVGSGRKIWWICEKGHEWPATINNRTKPKGNGCSVCSGHKILPGYNDLASLRPDVVAQWHPTLNGELTADMVAVGSGRKIWWICEKGHEWPATINSRTKPKGTGCPICSGNKVLTDYNGLATLRPEITELTKPAKSALGR